MRNVLIAAIVTALVGSLVIYRVTSSGVGSLNIRPFVAASRSVEDSRADALTAVERQVKAELELAVSTQTASDRVVRNNGREVRGQIVEENDESVKIVQKFGDSGEMTTTIDRDNIRSVHHAAAEVPEISNRDVRFKTEFPQLNLYRRPPYTIMTSQSYFDVQDVMRLLNGLHDEFVEVFAPVIATPERNDGIQLLFFTDEKDFRGYQRRHAPNMGFSVGFYNSGIDRFVIYDRKSSKQIKNAEKQLSSMKNQIEQRYNSRKVRNAVQVWHQSEARHLQQNANQSNRKTLRHEGAHQLFYTYGVHSNHHAENLWLIEGLAVYCENVRIGNRPLSRIGSLREAASLQRHIPFPKLINFRSPRGFGGIGPSDDAVLQAYAQSWFVVDFAMRRHKDGLFDYIRYVRDPRNVGPLGKQSRFATLSRFLDMRPSELDRALNDDLKRL